MSSLSPFGILGSWPNQGQAFAPKSPSNLSYKSIPPLQRMLKKRSMGERRRRVFSSMAAQAKEHPEYSSYWKGNNLLGSTNKITQTEWRTIITIGPFQKYNLHCLCLLSQDSLLLCDLVIIRQVFPMSGLNKSRSHCSAASLALQTSLFGAAGSDGGVTHRVHFGTQPHGRSISYHTRAQRYTHTHTLACMHAHTHTQQSYQDSSRGPGPKFLKVGKQMNLWRETPLQFRNASSVGTGL